MKQNIAQARQTIENHDAVSRVEIEQSGNEFAISALLDEYSESFEDMVEDTRFDIINKKYVVFGHEIVLR